MIKLWIICNYDKNYGYSTSMSTYRASTWMVYKYIHVAPKDLKGRGRTNWAEHRRDGSSLPRFIWRAFCRFVCYVVGPRNRARRAQILSEPRACSLARSLLQVRSIMRRTARRFHVESYRVPVDLGVSWQRDITWRRCSRAELIACRLLPAESRILRLNRALLLYILLQRKLYRESQRRENRQKDSRSRERMTIFFMRAFGNSNGILQYIITYIINEIMFHTLTQTTLEFYLNHPGRGLGGFRGFFIAVAAARGVEVTRTMNEITAWRCSTLWEA